MEGAEKEEEEELVAVVEREEEVAGLVPALGRLR